MNQVEVRCFGTLMKIFKDRGWPFPLKVDLPPHGITAADLAAMLGIPADGVEAVFINGRVQGLDSRVTPGDRVAFVPPGTPGPYRLLLGFTAGRTEP